MKSQRMFMMKNFIALAIIILTVSYANGQDDNDFDAYLKKANECFNAGNYDCALDNYTAYQHLTGRLGQDVSKQITKSEECKAARRLADDYFDDGNYEKAAEKYAVVTYLNPNDSYAKSRYDTCLDLKKPVTVVPSQLDTPKSKNRVIGGRDVSFGLTAGMIFANFKTSISGDFIGSAIDYGYVDNLAGTSYNSEKPSYKSKIGFSAGLLLDCRLYKNLYLQPGINYINAKIENSFNNSYWAQYYNSGTWIGVDPSTTTTYVQGTAYDKFHEKYTLHYIEMPLLLSYRFKLSERINYQIFAGPYFGIGVAGKCKITGSTDELDLVEYYIANDKPTGMSYYRNYIYSGELDLFGETGTSTMTNTISSWSGDYDHSFKASPFKQFNVGISLGTGFELAGFNIGVSYDWGLVNMANEEYWSDRMTMISGYKGGEMKDYKHKLNKFQVKIGYIFRGK